MADESDDLSPEDEAILDRISDNERVISIGEKLVKISSEYYFGKSHLQESLMTGKTNSPEEQDFKEKANLLVRDIHQLYN